MKPEQNAWRALNDHAAAQLSGGFADRVLRAAHGPKPEVWRALQSQAVAQLRTGFAERVLRAARQIPGVPSFLDQIVFSVGTAAVCALAIFFVNARTNQLEDERNLASWQQIAMAAAAEDPVL